MPLSFDSEKEFEDYLMGNQEFLEDSFGIAGLDIARQVNLGAYGIADIVAFRNYREPSGEPFCEVHIIELKNTPLCAANISQLARYRRFFLNYEDFFPYGNFSVECHLVGLPTFPANDDLCYLAQGIEWLCVYEMTIDPFSGMDFKHVKGWRPSKDNSDVFTKFKGLLVPQQIEDEQVAANEA